jgi:hypothetical protein
MKPRIEKQSWSASRRTPALCVPAYVLTGLGTVIEERRYVINSNIGEIAPVKASGAFFQVKAEYIVQP